MLRRIGSIVEAIVLCAVTAMVCAQTPRQATPAAGGAPATRPGLFFREEWKVRSQGGEYPVANDSIGNPNLDLKLYVPAGQIMVNNENGPAHVWTGLCTSPCAVAFREKAHFADLSGLARIRWTTKMSGLHQVRPIVKLADGSWWVGDRADGTTRDWLMSEISFGDLRWLKLDITRVVTVGTPVEKLDLTRVDEIGFADLMPGSGHGPGGWADVAEVEVYGSPVAREVATKR
jgi:hypothetical protein